MEQPASPLVLVLRIAAGFLSVLVLVENLQPGGLGFFSIALLVVCVLWLALRSRTKASLLVAAFGASAALSAIFELPLRGMVLVYRPELEAIVRSHPKITSSCSIGDCATIRVGGFDMHGAAQGSNGDVYVLTDVRGDGLGPDVLSIGLAYRPNPPPTTFSPQLTPFGGDRLELRHLVGDWYEFAVSDDY